MEGTFKKVLGVDILPMSSPSSKMPPKYAAFLLDDGKGRPYDCLDKRSLLSLINNVKPDIIALDNVFELASDQKGIISFMTRCPPSTRLVQVTGSPVDGMVPLSVLASQNGFPVGSLTPLKAAEICARLAAKGIGYIVRAFEDETKIVISRGRCPGHGGWSSERFKRRMYNLILQTTKEVQRRLNEYGLEYDLYTEDVEGGIKHSHFIVYANRSKVEQVVKPYRGDVIITVQPILLERLEWIPLLPSPGVSTLKRGLIVGIDPGITCGVAVLDLNGNLLFLHSEKELSRKELVRKLTSFGIPVLLASDVSPPPTLLEKLAGILNSRVFYPPRSLTVSEKREIVQRYLEENHVKIQDSHQRDALASALKAFYTFKNKFEKAEVRVKSLGLHVPIDQLKMMILKGVSISEAINLLSSPKVEEERKPVPFRQPNLDDLLRKLKAYRTKIKDLRRSLIRVKEQNLRLASEVKRLEEENRSLKEALESARFERTPEEIKRIMERYREENRLLRREIFQLKDELSKVRQELASMKRMRMMEIRGLVYPLKVIKSFTRSEIHKTDEKVGIKEGDIVYFLDGSGGGKATASILIDRKVKAIISKTKMSHMALEAFSEANIPVISSGKINIKQLDEFAVVDKKEFDTILLKYFEEKEKTEQRRRELQLEELLEDYRRERQRELNGK